MAKSVIKVMFLGNVGKEPEIRATPGGTIVANFSIATTERAKDQSGNWADKTEWHSLVAFGRLAEIIRDYVKKGSKLYKTEIVIGDISLLSGRGEGEGGGSYTRSGSSTSYDQRSSAPAEDYGQSAEITDDDIPF